MPFVSVLEAGLLVFCVLELLADGYPRMQKQIFYLAFAFAFVWSTMKFAYGPDIVTYLPLYREIATPGQVMRQWGNLEYESAFMLFTSVCKSIGLSFWGYSAIISTMYFLTVFLFLKDINYYPTIALTALVCLDSNLFLIQFRQCLAVVFFLLGVYCFIKKKHWLALLMLIVSICMHHSAIVILLICALIYSLTFLRTDYRMYALLILLFVSLLIIPFQSVLKDLFNNMANVNSIFSSISIHIGTYNKFQKIGLIYVALIITLGYCTRPNSGDSKKHWIIWCLIAVIVLLYQQWLLLNRIRSYFLLPIIVYTCSQLELRREGTQLVRQAFGALILCFICFDSFVSVPRHVNSVDYPTERICLITETRHINANTLEERQYQNARKYWQLDYRKHIDKTN